MASKKNRTLADMIRADVGEASIAAMGAVSDSDTAREQITYIPRTSLVADEKNFYSVDGIDQLAENIELVGLLDPLRVRPVEGDDGLYRIVSGHRRRAALDKLALDGNKSFERVPVIIERAGASPAMQELRLIYANMDTRRMSSADISKQAERVERLLYELKEEGYEFPGRMRAHVAEACKVSETKLATVSKIRKHLIDEWKARWEANTLSESAAYTLAQMPEERQTTLFEWFGDRPSYQLYENFLKGFGDTLKTIDNLKCPASLGGCGCSNRDNMRAAVKKQGLPYPPCRSCCEGCYDLSKCKYACSKFADKIAKLKADTRARRKQEKERAAAILAPRIDLNARMWKRAAEVRKAAEMSTEDFIRLSRSWFSDSVVTAHEKMERGEKKLTENSETPFPYVLNSEAAVKLVSIADRLGVSLDYLLCRTDDPTPSGAVSESDTDASQWRTGTPDREGRYWTCDVDGAQVVLWWSDGLWRVVPGSNRPHAYEIAKWYPLPEA